MDFPTFYQRLNAHMVLIPNDNMTQYQLCPPNQCDWMYTLSKISNTRWRVIGHKEDLFDMSQDIDYIYENMNGVWKYVKSN